MTLKSAVVSLHDKVHEAANLLLKPFSKTLAEVIIALVSPLLP